MAEETEKPKVATPSDQNLVVALRVRPMNEDEIIQGATPIAHKVDDNLVVLMDPMEDPDDILRANRSREKKYVYDRAFDGSTTQAEVYESTCKVLIPSVISGYNATVFAYGATGAGKTYTMLGSPDDPGIMARALNDLFLEMDKTYEDMTYKVAMSYLEIYNEMIRDLLNPGSGYLELREDSKGVQVSGLSEVTAKSTREVIGMLIRGNKERTQEPTAANKASSRSHAILQVTVRQRNKVRNTVQQVRVGKLFLIDLAGSERAANTQNRGKRMLEGAHINRSLLALGNCINALSDKSSQRYVNYRDSKLTRLLKDALGGNCKTVMIAHISPASIHFEESRNTLVYADRAKHIKTKVRRNVIDVSYHIAQYTNIISELREEVKRLKTKLDEQQQSKSIQAIQSGVLHAAGKEEQVHLNRLKDQLLGVFQDQMNLRRTLMELNNNAMEISLETTRHQLMIKEYEREKLAKKQEAQEAEAEDNKLKEEANSNEKAFLTETPEEAEPDDVKTAREELKGLEEETQHTQRLKVKCQKELDNARERAAKLEEVIPTKIKSAEQLEIWRLLCKVHELEIENLEMQSSCLLRNFEIRKQGMIIAKYEQHRSLCDEIIQQQRVLLDERKLNCPQELEDLYDMYMQETRDMEENVPTLDTEHDNDRAGLAPHKFPSVTSINKRFLEAESISEQDKFSDAPTFRSGGANSVQRKQLKKRSANNINMLPKYEETPKEALFSQSPKAKEIRAAQRKEVAASLGGRGSPAQMAPLTVAKRQSSVVTLNSSRSSTNRSPSPPVIKTRLASDKDLNQAGGSSKEDRAMIMTSTRNIAALAARKRTKATLDAFNNDTAFNRTYTSLNTHSEQIDRTDRSDRRRDKDSYLTPSRLAIHDKIYDRSSVLLKHDDAISVGTGDPHSDILHDRQPVRPGLTRLQKNTKNEATKKRTKSHNYANYNQLAKSSPRRKPVKKLGARGSQNGGITGRTTRRSRLPGPIPQDKASRALVPAGIDLSTYDDDIREFETAQTPPTTVYQSGTDRGRGLSVQRKVRVPGFSDSSSSSTPQGNGSRASKKQAATIPNYRKGDLTVAGFSLQR